MIPTPSDPAFWSATEFQKDITKIFDVCNGCRRCFSLCPSFDFMFERLDTDAVDGDAEKLTSGDTDHILDLCYQCKLCYNHCPYTPPHRFDIDFPRQMLRGKAQQAKTRGIKLQDRVIGSVHLVGQVGSMTAAIANPTNKLAPVRLAIEKVAGVHRKRNLPQFAGRTFQSWAKKKRPGPLEKKGKVALFYTCTVNYYMPEIAKAAVAVLEHNGLEVIVPPQKCCSMPILDYGDIDGSKKWARQNVDNFAQVVAEGAPILALGPTCSYVLKHDYPYLLGEEGDGVGDATLDICEYLMRLHGDGELDTEFSQSFGKIAYHLPCHLKSQNIGFKSRDLLRLIPDTEITMVDRCSGMDGGWGMKRDYYELSLKVARKMFNDIEEAEADMLVTDCPLAGVQIEEGTQRRPLHPVQVLAMAYGLNPDGSKA